MSASALGARRSSRQRSGSDSASSLESSEKLHLNAGKGRGTKYPARRSSSKTVKQAVTVDDSSDGDDDGDEDGDEDGDADEDGQDEGDDEDVQDSNDDTYHGATAREVTHKRGHQTGLSVSLSNTSLGKRGRSPGSPSYDDRPASKMSRTDNSDDSSDDEAYNGVDDISDADREDDAEAMEEQMIIESEEDEEETIPHRKSGSFSSADTFFGLGDAPEGNLVYQAAPTLFDERMADIEFSAGRRNSVLQRHDDSAPAPRRVRFAEEVQHYASTSSSSSETESEDEAQIYPDLFLQQSSLDPGFRKLIEQNDDASGSDGEGSYWDFENDDRVEEVDDDESGSCTDSSGYESDEGETTDEEIVVPSTVRNPDLLFKNSRMNAPRTPTTTPIRRALANARKGPTMGSFLIDEDKPIALVDGHGTHMLFFPAPKERRKAASSPSQSTGAGTRGPVAPSQDPKGNEVEIGFTHTDPMLSSPANAMMAGLGDGHAAHNPSVMANHPTGPEEAFFPFVNVNANGSIDAADDDPFDDAWSEDDLKLEDFINFGNDSSDDGNDEPAAEQQDDPFYNNTSFEDENDLEGNQMPPAKFTAVKSRAQSNPTPAPAGSLLEHFDKGVASSFRRNADRHKLWTRSPVTAGIKGGRYEVANNTISPLRRRRGFSAAAANPLPRMRHPAPAEAVEMTSASPKVPTKRRIQNANQLNQLRNKRRKNSV